MKKILIIDDKPKDIEFNSISLIEILNDEQKQWVDLRKSFSGLFDFNDQEDALLKFNFNIEEYGFIFIHQSKDNPVIKNPDIIIKKLPKDSFVVLFSGRRSEALKEIDIPGSASTEYDFPQAENGNKHYEIKRSIYYENFADFLDLEYYGYFGLTMPPISV